MSFFLNSHGLSVCVNIYSFCQSRSVGTTLRQLSFANRKIHGNLLKKSCTADIAYISLFQLATIGITTRVKNKRGNYRGISAPVEKYRDRGETRRKERRKEQEEEARIARRRGWKSKKKKKREEQEEDARREIENWKETSGSAMIGGASF